MKLLIVEDEKVLLKALAKGLGKLGYAVDCAGDGEEALALYEVNAYDLMVLDLNLPKIDGLTVLRHIRKQDPSFRILILSARNSVEDRICGLDFGANDYLSKPFDFRELEARIRGLLRREFIQKDAQLSLGGLRVDMAGHTAYWENTMLPLTKKEYGILEYILMYHRSRIISAEDLLEHVWNSDADLFSNTLKYHMSTLRKKLYEASGGFLELINLRGQGYRIELKEVEP